MQYDKKNKYYQNKPKTKFEQLSGTCLGIQAIVTRSFWQTEIKIKMYQNLCFFFKERKIDIQS